MTGPRFADLWLWDVRHIGRNPLLWAILLVLGVSLVWSAWDTSILHRAQTQAQIRVIAAETAHHDAIEARAQAYRAPVSPSAPEIPYWQDPTNVSGFSQYFVFRNASKPHLPLSPLAVGVSDVAPSRLEIQLNTLFGFEDSYDFENPRGLALGRFDLGFVIAYLLPVALILLFGLLVTFEKDRGMLRIVAAQATPPRLWLGARLAAILAWVVPAILVEFLIALAIAGVPLIPFQPELGAALLVLTAYIALWTGIAALVLSRLPGSAGALGILTAIWAGLTIGLPLLGGMLSTAVDPPPSSMAYINARRETNDAIQVERVAILKRAFAANPALRKGADQPPALDHATELTFLVPEAEGRLASLREAMTGYALQQSRMATAAGYLALPLGMERALATLAGTDEARHHQFQAQARSYQLKLRELLYPLVQREVVAPTPRSTPPLRGRFNLADRELPRFVMVNESASVRGLTTLPFAAWLTVLGLALALWGVRRARKWQADL